MIEIDATFAASKKTDNPLERRIFFIKGLSNATKINDGMKIAIVDTTAPTHPPI